MTPHKLAVMLVLTTVGCGQIHVPSDFGKTTAELAATEPWPLIRFYKHPPARVSAKRLDCNLFQVELKEFDQFAVHQHSREGCWAACVEMVTAYHSHRLDQGDLIKNFNGRVHDDARDAGTIGDILRPLIGPDRFTFVNKGVGNWIAQDLYDDSPVLLALSPKSESEFGHVVVVTGMTFSINVNGEVAAHNLLYYDPADGKPYPLDEEGIIELRRRIAYGVYFRDHRVVGSLSDGGEKR